MIRKPTGRRILTFTVAALFAGALAVAQQQPGTSSGSQNQQNQNGQPQMPGQTNPDSESGEPGPQMSMSRAFADQVFVRRILVHSFAEARISLLAEEKSPSDDIRHFGQRIVLVHNQLDAQFSTIAREVDVRETHKLDKKQEQEIDQLSALSGPAFDQAYIQAMARYQRHDVKEFKTEANVAQDPAIQQAARQDAPAYARRLSELEQIARDHNVAIAEK